MGFRRTIMLRDGSCLLVRTFSLDNIISLHSMYSLLSDESKRFFHPCFFQPKLGWMWVRDEILLILSGISVVRNILMKIFPIAVYLPLIVLNSKREIVAFAFYKIRRRLPQEGFEAEQGTVVRDDYQGRGLGSQLLRYGNEFAWINQIRKLYSLVNAQNLKMIRLNQKLGFQIVRLVKKRNTRSGRHYQAYEMIIHLDGRKGVVKGLEALNK